MRVGWNILAMCTALGAAVAFADGPGADQAATAPASQPGSEIAAGQNWFGVAVENIPPQISRQLKLRPDQGLMVLAVLTDTPAERAGVKADDILIEIDGAPLTSQEDLAQAANAMMRLGDKVVPRSSRITYLRDGDRAALEITPAPRPASMIAMGANLRNFTTRIPTDTQLADNHFGVDAAPEAGVRNYAFANGTAAQIGPGYRMNLGAGGASSMTSKSIQSVVAKGQTIILTQETDARGLVKNTMTVGGTTYVVQAGRLDLLPEELRPIGEQMLATSAAGSEAAELEQRVRVLEEENRALQSKLSELIDTLKKQEGDKAPVKAQGQVGGGK